ncbi:MAG TPA: hypothetical protein VMZ53_03630 [Kofleriaceae bacterium]|nr:hypothetical protein [Kofleriaceae bacterium]
MIPPSKRIWIYPDRTFTRPRDLEIIVLGEPEVIAPFMVELRNTIESWPGFDQVHPITMGEQLLGFRASRSKLAEHDDPVAEAMLMLKRFPIEWTGNGYGLGIVGLW